MLRQARSPPTGGSRLASTQSMQRGKPKCLTPACLWRHLHAQARSPEDRHPNSNRLSRNTAGLIWSGGPGSSSLSPRRALCAQRALGLSGGGPSALSGGPRTALLGSWYPQAGGWGGGGVAAPCGPFKRNRTKNSQAAPTRTQSINLSRTHTHTHRVRRRTQLRTDTEENTGH